MSTPLPRRPALRPRATRSGPCTVEAEGASKVEGETVPRRHPSARSVLAGEPEPGVATIFDVLKHGSRKFGDANALGSRKVLNTHAERKEVPDGRGGTAEKDWRYYELSDYSYTSYSQFERNALQAGTAMRKLGLQRNDRIEIYAASSAFWLTVAHGACSQSITIVTAYDTLGEEGLFHSLKQTGAKAVFLDPALLPRAIKALDHAEAIRAIVFNDAAAEKVDAKQLEALKDRHPQVFIQSFSNFLGSAAELVETVPPSADDLACIMYTSGSTGAPKGVMLKHRTVMAAVAGASAIILPHLVPGDRLLTYLPLAHIIEFVFETAGLYWGAVMGYGSARTLTDQSVRNCAGDIRAFKPSFMVGVPAVWEGVRKGILSKVGAPGTLKSRIFWSAMYLKESLLYWGLPGVDTLDAITFSKIKEATGGNLRLVLNGGGPIAESTLKFVSLVICPMLGGYGLTETAGMGALVDPYLWTSSTLGGMPPSVEVKLVDLPDLDYLTSHDPPQGEIWIRGPAVIEEYLDSPEENSKAFHDGWFKTGDIGTFDGSGQLEIIDRKKNLVKTLNGEYIALEKLESLYRATPIVVNICVHASPDQAKPIAVIEPAGPALQRLGQQLGYPGASHGALCKDQAVRAAVCKELQAVGKQNSLQGIEIVQAVVLSEEAWTPQNGFLTNAHKLNRRAVVERYQKDIQEAYRM